MNLPSSTDPNINALLAGGDYWWQIQGYFGPVAETSDGISGIQHNLTFSFATNSGGDSTAGFKQMGPSEQAAVRRALAYISSLYDITFTEVAPGQGEINYGTNDQGTTSAGYAYYPDPLFGSSNVYINNNASSGYGENSSYADGTYAWQVLLHETAHTLGLKHPGNYNAGSSTGTEGPYLPLATDYRSNTIMSYNNIAADLVYRNGNVVTDYASTYMMYDFEALDYLYGKNTRDYDTSSGFGGPGTVIASAAPSDQVFTWGPNATPFETLYAVGSNNSINLSGQGLPSVVNLNAGTLSSINERLTDADKLVGLPSYFTVHEFDVTAKNANGQTITHTLADGINDVGIAPGAEIDQVSLGSGANTVYCNNNGDTVYSYSGRDTVYGGNGADTFNISTSAATGGVMETFNGGSGADIATINGYRSNYSLLLNSDGSLVLTDKTSGDQVSLISVSSLRFNDISYTLGPNLPAPVTTARSSTFSAAHGQLLHFSDLFSAQALATAGIERYSFEDVTSGNGVILLNGVAQATNTNIVVTAADLSKLTFLGSGTDVIYARANDGLTWSAYAHTTVTAPVDQAPTITAVPLATPRRLHDGVSLSELFSVSDPENDVPTRYQVNFSSSDGSSFSLSGLNVPLSEPTSETLTASQFDGAGFDLAATDTISVRAFDGVKWSNWATITVGFVNVPPTVTALNSAVSATRLQSFGYANLFVDHDPQGSSIVKYDFYDYTPGDGAIEINGVVQAAQTDIVVGTGEIGSLSFVASGSDMISVRVWDGYSWSARQKVTITAGAVDLAPTVTSSTITPPRVGTIVNVSSLFSATDPEGDTITKYRIYDATLFNGTLRWNGIDLGNNSFYFDPADLSNLTFTVGTSDTLEIRAFDGLNWSGWKAITLSGANLAPTVTALSAAVSAGRLQSFSFADLFVAHDPQNSAIVKYDFYDGTPGDGAIEINGVVQAAQTDIIVTADQLSSLSFVASGSDTLSVRVWDGYSWSTRTTVTITGTPANRGPGVTALALATPRPGATLAVSDLFSATDPEGDPITEYRIYDATPGGGTLRLNGVNQLNNSVYLTPATIGNLTFTAGTSDTLEVRAFDGLTWGAWQAVTINGANLAPTVTALNTAVSAGHLQVFGFSDLFTTGDPQGSNIVKYDLYESGTGNGAIEVNGVKQALNTDVIVTSDQLASLSFVASGTDVIYARVWDGYSWSTRQKVTVSAVADTGLTVTPNSNVPGLGVSTGFRVSANPLVDGITDFTTTSNQLVQATDLFSASGASRYRIQDVTPGVGALKLNGVSQGTNIVTVAASDLGSVTFTTGTGAAHLYVSAYDGLIWGKQADIRVAASPAAAPLAAPLPALASPLGPNAGLAAATLMTTASDPFARHGSGFAAAS